MSEQRAHSVGLAAAAAVVARLAHFASRLQVAPRTRSSEGDIHRNTAKTKKTPNKCKYWPKVNSTVSRQKRRRTELCSKMEREMANAWKGEMQPPKSMLKRFFWSLPTCKGSAQAWRRAQAGLGPSSGAGLGRGGRGGRGLGLGLGSGLALTLTLTLTLTSIACSVGELSLATLASCTFLLDMQHARPSYESWNIWPCSFQRGGTSRSSSVPPGSALPSGPSACRVPNQGLGPRVRVQPSPDPNAHPEPSPNPK